MAEIFSGLMRRVITRSRRAALVLSALALAVPALAACSPGTGAQNPNATQIKAVASTTQICDYVTQLASGGQDLAFTRTGADGKTAELGADALKTEFVGDEEAERVMIEEAGNIPVLTLGGAAASPEEVAAAARGAIASGAKGLIFGRNAWQVPDMEGAMRELSHIVHG